MGRKYEHGRKQERPSKIDLVGTLTQALYSRAIRIRRPLRVDEIEDVLAQADEVILNWLRDQNQKLAEGAPPPPSITTDAEDEQTFFQEQLELVADIGTGLWRLRQRLINPETGQPLEETRRAYRHLQSVWDAIHDAGYLIQDHTGQPFNARQTLKVITYEQKPDIEREIVSETIKPSVYYQREGKDVLIQMGEVIVATPVTTDGNML